MGLPYFYVPKMFPRFNWRSFLTVFDLFLYVVAVQLKVRFKAVFKCGNCKFALILYGSIVP